MRFFRLSDGGVRCGEDGLFIGSTPLLVRSWRPSGGESWAVRPNDELERDLGGCYGVPIDIVAKRGGLAGVARALERGDMALAKIAALLLRFPDPPSLAKGAPDCGSLELTAQLFESGLLKEWDESKHPRLGGPPNRGRFAVNPDKGELTAAERSQRKWPVLPELWLEAKRALRAALKETAEEVVALGRVALWADPRLKVAVEAALELMTSSELNTGEQKVIDQVRASIDPPKTLDELRQIPTQNVLGYERHHIVEQNDDNIAKSPLESVTEKFGRDVIDDPSNVIWVPRLKHELITAYYNSKAARDTLGRLYRQVVNAMDYQDQREAGLAALRMFGVMQ